jgi:hypothetical protein
MPTLSPSARPLQPIPVNDDPLKLLLADGVEERR